jgi:hypothetical protein
LTISVRRGVEVRRWRRHLPFQHSACPVHPPPPIPRALEPVGWPLSADQLKRLDEVSGEMAPYPYYPYRIQEGFARLNPPPV